jgi:ABC-type multidrug transport system ATPase subunit
MLPSDESVGAFLTHLARLQGLPRRRAITAAYDALADVDGKAWWRQRCASLSHGMAKRVALAQAFLGAPDIVLLDEPTAGLDPRIASEVRQLIASKRGTATIVISSHNLPELEQLCDAAAILDRGRVAAQGTMATLTAANEEVRIWVGAGTPLAADAGAVPAAALRDLPAVRSAHFDDDARLLTVSFDPSQADAETVIGRVLTTLLAHGVRISGVAKGRGLEQRVMDLT